MDISYGILDYNPHSDPEALRLLIKCIGSLSANLDSKFKSEVFLLNQGNRDPDYGATLSALCRQHGFHYLSLLDNVGISRGINYIYQLARGDVISLVTSDVEISSGVDSALIAEFDAQPKLYQVTPSANVSSVRYQIAQTVTGAPLTRCIANELTIQFWRRQAFEEIGFWDERWKACYENNDWTLRLFLAGYDTAISFNCICHHHHNTTSKNGSINLAYDGYLDMPGGLDHKLLRGMWNQKWPDLDWNFMYNPGRLTEQNRQTMKHQYQDNLWLPLIQEVGY